MTQRLGDTGVAEYILQFVQALRDEPFVDSALARFLLTRALRNPSVVGHRLYWLLTAEMSVHREDETTRTRFAMLLELLLRHCGAHRYVLGQQAYLMAKLEYCAEAVKNARVATKDGRNAELRERLSAMLQVLPSSFQLPLYPDVRFRSIILDKCRVMDSKKKPLWLCFELADDSPSPAALDAGMLEVVAAAPATAPAPAHDQQRIGTSSTGRVGRGRGRGPAGPAGTAHRTGVAVSSPPQASADKSLPRSDYGGGRFVRVLFKAGDDLRQDQLTLQVLRVLHRLWHADGLDARMTPYGCVATGKDLGMLEVVDDAATLAGIVADAADKKKLIMGKRLGAAVDALGSQSNSLAAWLANQAAASEEGAATRTTADGGAVPQAAATGGDRHSRVAPTMADPMDKIMDNFVRSCAGYCVATHVLGIGDRHNDNIMLTKNGRLLHIDFGHFLGNFKEKFGFKREKAPFIFTPAMAAVLGGEGSAHYNAFVKLSCRLFRATREHARLITTLFCMMIPSGIPELRTVADVEWIEKKLLLDEVPPPVGLLGDDAQAPQQATLDAHFEKLVQESLSCQTTRVNDAIHLMKHA